MELFLFGFRFHSVDSTPLHLPRPTQALACQSSRSSPQTNADWPSTWRTKLPRTLESAWKRTRYVIYIKSNHQLAHMFLSLSQSDLISSLDAVIAMVKIAGHQFAICVSDSETFTYLQKTTCPVPVPCLSWHFQDCPRLSNSNSVSTRFRFQKITNLNLELSQSLSWEILRCFCVPFRLLITLPGVLTSRGSASNELNIN